MTFAIILAIIAAIFYAATNHIDKYLISKAVKNADYRSLILVSTIIAGGVMALIYLFVCNFQLAFDIPSIALLFVNSIITTSALILYFKSLNRDDTTIIVIMFQLIPVFMLFLSPIFLSNQVITPIQLLGGGIITLAAILITYEPAKKKFDKGKLITLGLMSVVSILYALWFVLERYVNQNHDFNQTIFWSNLTLFIVGSILFVVIPSYRKSFLKMLNSNGPKIVGLNLISELLSSFSNVFSTFAGTLAPIALVSFTTQGMQPFAVMIIGIMLTKFLPKTEKENITKKVVIRRTITIVLCLIGLACIEFG